MIGRNYVCTDCNMEFYIESLEDYLEFCPVCGGLSLDFSGEEIEDGFYEI